MSYFRGRHYFVGDDDTQNYIAFHPMKRYFKKIVNTKKISTWESKGLSDDIIKPLGNTHAPKLIYSGKRMYVKFDGNNLKQDKITFNHGKTINIYIVYEITKTKN